MPTTVERKSDALLEPIACPICENKSDFFAFPGSRTDHHIKKLGIGEARSHWAVCKKCGLVMQNPRPSAAVYQRLYDGGVYHEHHLTPDQIDKSVELVNYCFDEKVDYVHRVASRRFASPGNVLDIGCGMGGALFVFQQRGYKVFGMQPDPNLTKIAKERFGLSITNGYFSDETYQENFFDIVFTNHAFEHFDDPLAVARGIARVLRPGGLCFTCIPTYERNKTLTALDWMNVSHNWIYTHHTLAALFKRAGLLPVSHTSNGTAKYTDETWLIVEKPKEGSQPQTPAQAIQGCPAWTSVVRSIRWTVPARTALYWPWTQLQKVKRFVYLMRRSRTETLGSFVRQVFRTKVERLKLWMNSFGSHP